MGEKVVAKSTANTAKTGAIEKSAESKIVKTKLKNSRIPTKLAVKEFNNEKTVKKQPISQKLTAAIRKFTDLHNTVDESDSEQSEQHAEISVISKASAIPKASVLSEHDILSNGLVNSVSYYST